MTRRIGSDETYHEQLSRWTQALATGRADDLATALAEGSTPAHVRLFSDGHHTKRHEAIRTQLEFVAGAFADFEDLLAAYLGERPSVAYDTVTEDAARFLEWIERSRDLTPEQNDHMACQRARHAVEAAARTNRAGRLRFQKLWAATDQRAGSLATDANVRVSLNPIRAWSRFATAALLDAEASLPADVLFFAVDTGISTAVLEPVGRELVGELACWEPCTLEHWTGLSQHAGREEIVELCRDLAQMGLMAFGEN